jgi:hypothetical protein
LTINPLTEDLIWPTEATKLYPRGPSGKTVHVSRVYRDMKRGRDGIVLESIRTPRMATSRQAVARFFRALSEAHQPTGQVTIRSRSSESMQSDRSVEQELDRIGI